VKGLVLAMSAGGFIGAWINRSISCLTAALSGKRHVVLVHRQAMFVQGVFSGVSGPNVYNRHLIQL